MHDADGNSDARSKNGVYVVAPWLIAVVGLVGTLLTLGIRASESAFFWTTYLILLGAIAAPAGIVAGRVAYVASTHVAEGTGRRAAVRYFLAAFMLTSALLVVMLPSL